MSAETQLVTTEKDLVEFVPFGADESIKLSIAIVQNIIAVPTKTGKLPDRRDCIKFMMLCRGKHLDPFTGDCYMLGYDTQAGPQFSLITAHQVFLKRAEASEQFDAMESGVILLCDPPEKGLVPLIVEREGDFTTKGETLLGGWAKVYRKDRSKPFYRRSKLETYSTGQSRWAKDPAGMIVKVAEADALRSAFPTHLGGLYLHEENNEKTLNALATAAPKFVAPLADTKALPAQEEESAVPKPKKEPVERATPLQGLRNLAASAEVTDAQLLAFLHRQGSEAESLETAGEGEFKTIIANWVEFLPDIKGETATPATAQADAQSDAGERTQRQQSNEIPVETSELIQWVKDECVRRDLDESALLAWAKAAPRKWAGAATRISEMGNTGLGKLARAMDLATAEIGG